MSKKISANVILYVDRVRILGGYKTACISIPGSVHETSLKKSIVDVENSNQINLDSDKFKLKIVEIDGDKFVKIKSPSLEDEYLVMNFEEQEMVDLLLGALNDRGDFGETLFDAVFSSDSSYITFTCPGMKGYEDAVEEFNRSVYYELNPKTRKWIPGHKYGSKDKTFIYLGKFKCIADSPSKKETSIGYSNYTDDPKKFTECYLIVNKLKESEKTITDVFKGRYIDYSENNDNIEYTFTAPACVDMGEVLVNDFSNISDFREDMIKNLIANEKKTESREFGYYKHDLHDLWQQFLFNSTEDLKNSNLELTDLIIDIIKQDITDDIAFTYYNKLEYRSKYSMIRNMKEFFEKYYGIKVEDLVKEVGLYWENYDNTRVSFEKFLKFSHRINQAKGIDIRENELSTLIKGDSLESVLKEMYNKCLDGEDVCYSYTRKKDKTTGKQDFSVVISLEDIIKYIKGVSKAPESLKLELQKNKFSEIRIYSNTSIRL